MKVLLQKVTDARVEVEGEVVGAIESGLLLYVGFHKDDKESMIVPHVEKVLNLRVFRDESGKMNHSVMDKGQDLLVVSQFTLYGNVSNGRRPSFIDALSPDIAEPYYEKFIAECKSRYQGGRVERGKFGAMMKVSSTNQGPINFIVEL